MGKRRKALKQNHKREVGSTRDLALFFFCAMARVCPLAAALFEWYTVGMTNVIV